MTNIRNAEVWIPCSNCNGSLHKVFSGSYGKPWWFCRDRRVYLKSGDEVEVVYMEDK